MRFYLKVANCQKDIEKLTFKFFWNKLENGTILFFIINFKKLEIEMKIVKNSKSSNMLEHTGKWNNLKTYFRHVFATKTQHLMPLSR